MSFLNDTELDTEGELNFPMSEGKNENCCSCWSLGAVMCGYAVDMEGVLVDGVVVEVSVMSCYWLLVEGAYS